MEGESIFNKLNNEEKNLTEEGVSLEKKKTKRNLLNVIVEKGKLAGLGLVAFLASCEGPEAPSQRTIHEYFSQNPTAERIDTTKIQNWHNVVKDFNEAKKENKHLYYLDLRYDFEKSLSQKSEYKEILNIYEADMTNDSTLYITEYDPVVEKIHGDRILAHNRKYIFHEDGDVEMFMGNLVDEEGTSESDGAFMAARVDGQTGGILYYDKDDFAQNNSFRLTKEGEMKVGDDYGYPRSSNAKVATKSFDLLDEDVRRIKGKLQEK